MAGRRIAGRGGISVKVTRGTFFLAGRLAIGVIFLYAGGIKIGDAQSFAGQVAAYRLLPYAFNYLAAATLPAIELLCGALLLFNLRVRPALLVLGGLNLGFIVALVAVMLRGLEIDCGCFDPTGRSGTGPAEALLRDLVLMGLIIMTWLTWTPATRDGGRGK